MSKTMFENFIKFIDSPEGKIDIENYFNKINGMYEIQKKRYKRFEEWIETNDFDRLMYRLILEHDADYIDKCQYNGYMPFPNNKLDFVVNYVFHEFETIKVGQLDCDFPNEIRCFKGYYFQHIYGQGTILRIYNKDDLKMLLQL